MHNKDFPKEFFLPPELLGEIYKRLVPNDQIRFGSVCKAWLSVVISEKPHRPPPVPEPWLMLGPRGRGSYLWKYRFHCLSDKRVYKFNNVVPKDYEVVTMSCDGWLLTESPRSSHLKLVNPILNAQIRMIPPPRDYWWFDVKNIKKLLVLESTSSTESIVTTLIMLLRPRRSMVYTNYKFQVLNYLEYDDIVLYKGELYALAIRENSFGIQVFDKEQFALVQCHFICGIANNSKKDEAYLVESGGDLLFVRRQPNNLLQTAGFDVFKVATVRNSGDAIAVKLQSLGDHQALFWGREGCFSLPVGESSQFEEDHIYFTLILKEQPLTEEYGVYSLKDGSIKQIPNLYLPRPPSSSTKSFWFFPTAKDTTAL